MNTRLEYVWKLKIKVKKNPKDIVKKWVNKIGLNINDAYRLSWDDKYLELCEEQGIERFNEVTFDRPMPSVKKRR